MGCFDTVTFDRFLHALNGDRLSYKEKRRELATNTFQTYDLEKKHRSYKIQRWSTK